MFVMKNNRNLWTIDLQLPGWGKYHFRADHFVIRNWKQGSLATFLSMEQLPFYKVFHITSGKGMLVAGLRHYILYPGDIAFLRPNEIIAWTNLSAEMEGHFCFVHPKFLKHANHVLEMFVTFPHAHPDQAVVPLTKLQSEKIEECFKLMHQEATGHFDDKKQAILIYLQMILLRVRRAGRIANYDCTTKVNRA